jgi:hypothetical protein
VVSSAQAIVADDKLAARKVIELRRILLLLALTTGLLFEFDIQ